MQELQVKKPEAQGTSQAGERPSRTSTSRVLGLGNTKVTLLPSDTLDEKCKICSENLRACVQEALSGTAMEYSYAGAALRIIQAQLDEHRLRLDIWMADCCVPDGKLSKIAAAGDSLSDSLGDTFARLLSEIVMIYNNIINIKQNANKAWSEQDVVVERKLKESIDDFQARTLGSCDNLNSLLYELAEMQSAVQMALAIYADAGPEAPLRSSIAQFGAKFRSGQQEMGDEDASLSAPTDEAASRSSSEEKCPKCRAWFPWNSLPLHVDLCSGQENIQSSQAAAFPYSDKSDTRGGGENTSGPTKKHLIEEGSGGPSSARGEFVIDDTISITSQPYNTGYDGGDHGPNPLCTLLNGYQSHQDIWFHYSGCLGGDIERDKYYRSLNKWQRSRIREQKEFIRERKSQITNYGNSESMSILEKVLNDWRRMRRTRYNHDPESTQKPVVEKDQTQTCLPGAVLMKFNQDHFRQSSPGGVAPFEARIPTDEFGPGGRLQWLYDEETPGDLLYLHFPANNVIWVENFIAWYKGRGAEEAEPKTREEILSLYTGNLHKHRRDHCKDTVYGRSIKPALIISAESGIYASEYPSVPESQALSLFVPYMTTGTYDEWLRSSRLVQKLKSQEAERQRRGRSSIPRARAILRKNTRILWPGSDAWHPTILGKLLLCAAEVYREMEFVSQKELLESFLFLEPPLTPLHPRKTLAQYKNWTWQDTEDKDRRQVLFQESSGARAGSTRLVMVDQLWLFILDKRTVVSCFPSPARIGSRDMNIHDHISQKLRSIARSHSLTVNDIAAVVVDQCTQAFFDQHTIPDVLDIFAKKLGSLNKRADIRRWHLQKWLSRRSFQAPPMSILDTKVESFMMDDVQDTLEELETMSDILRKQAPVIAQFHHASRSLSKFRLLGKVEAREDDLRELLTQAQDVIKKLSMLYTQKQDQIRLIEGQDIMENTYSTIMQQRTLSQLTNVSVIFLPLIFLTIAVEFIQYPIDLSIILPISFAVIVVSFTLRDSKLLRALLSLYSTTVMVYSANERFVNKLVDKINSRERQLLEKQAKARIHRKYGFKENKDNRAREIPRTAGTSLGEAYFKEKETFRSRGKGKAIDIV